MFVVEESRTDLNSLAAIESIVQQFMPIVTQLQSYPRKDAESTAISSKQKNKKRKRSLGIMGSLTSLTQDLHKKIANKMQVDEPVIGGTRFQAEPRRISRGAILHGKPGTGRTTFAKALAGHFGIRMLFCPGPSIVRGVVGAQEKVTRKLFDTAAAHTPCIVIIDEIDSILRKRLTADEEESKKTRNLSHASEVENFLCEIDKLPNEVFIIGTTNSIKWLDDAAIRPGRLGMHVDFNLISSEKGFVRKLLCFHLGIDEKNTDQKEKEDQKDQKEQLIDWSMIESLCDGKTGAELAEFANFLLSMYPQSEPLFTRHFLVAKLLQKYEPANDVSLEYCRRAAEHEAGHALVAFFLDASRLNGLHCVPTADDGGCTWIKPVSYLERQSADHLKSQIAILMGGVAAEQLGRKESLGRRQDLKLAQSMALLWVQNQVGGTLGQSQLGIEEHAQRLVAEGLTTASQILKQKHRLWEKVAERCAEERYISEQRLRQLDKDLRSELTGEDYQLVAELRVQMQTKQKSKENFVIPPSKLTMTTNTVQGLQVVEKMQGVLFDKNSNDVDVDVDADDDDEEDVLSGLSTLRAQLFGEKNKKKRDEEKLAPLKEQTDQIHQEMAQLPSLLEELEKKLVKENERINLDKAWLGGTELKQFNESSPSEETKITMASSLVKQHTSLLKRLQKVAGENKVEETKTQEDFALGVHQLILNKKAVLLRMNEQNTEDIKLLVTLSDVGRSSMEQNLQERQESLLQEIRALKALSEFNGQEQTIAEDVFVKGFTRLLELATQNFVRAVQKSDIILWISCLESSSAEQLKSSSQVREQVKKLAKETMDYGWKKEGAQLLTAIGESLPAPTEKES